MADIEKALPSDDVIDILASTQFTYAATVLKFVGEEYYPSYNNSVSCHIPYNLLLELEPLSQIATPSTLRFVDSVFIENVARFFIPLVTEEFQVDPIFILSLMAVDGRFAHK